MDMIYLDAAAAELPHPKLAEWYAELNREIPFNPHGGTVFAEKAKRYVIAAENTIKNIIGADDNATIVWTSGITEALNLAVNSLSSANISKTAHPSLTEPAEKTGKMQNDGAQGVSHINSETGAISDLCGIRERFGEAKLLVDAAQSFCKIDIPWRNARIDMLAVSSRKIGGPSAVGALIVRHGIKIKPLLWGGGQQNGLRPGTLDAVGISLFARVAQERRDEQEAHLLHVARLNEYFWWSMEQSGIKYERISPKDGYPGIAMFAVPGYDGAVISRILAAEHEVLVSSASACTAETGRPSPSLIASTGSEQLARSALRVSFSSYNTMEHIGLFIVALQKTLKTF